MKILLLLCGFLWSESVNALELKPTLFYASLAAGDLASTHYAESLGATEANPLMKNQGSRYALKVAQVAGFAWLDGKLEHRKGLRWAVRGIFAGVTGAAIIHNARTGK